MDRDDFSFQIKLVLTLGFMENKPVSQKIRLLLEQTGLSHNFNIPQVPHTRKPSLSNTHTLHKPVVIRPDRIESQHRGRKLILPLAAADA